MTNERAQALAAARNALGFLAMNQTEPITVEKIGGDARRMIQRRPRMSALVTAPPVIATRVTMHEAKRHFEAGGAVLVSEYGHEPTQTVTAITTTHDRTRTTWDALAADVKEWRNRYPNQRFYIVPRPGVVAVDDARPADPEVAE